MSFEHTANCANCICSHPDIFAKDHFLLILYRIAQGAHKISHHFAHHSRETAEVDEC